MKKQFIDYLMLLRDFPPDDGTLIATAFEERRFREGDYLFRAGKVCRQLFFVCQGVVKIDSISDKGVERTHFFYSENKFCTILQSFNEQNPSDASIRACCEVEALVIGKAALLELYRRMPWFREVIGQLQQAHLIEKVNVRNSYLGLDAEEQYRLFVNENPGIIGRIAQQDIASFLGITRQSLSRIRKQIR
jgi:CRP-like cAMP-binding protein